MAPTTSFAPTAERLSALAEKIRADLGGRILIEQIYGVMFCIMLHCFVRICHRLDAQAGAAARVAGLDVPVGAERIGAVDGGDRRLVAGPAAPRVRLYLVPSRAEDVAAAHPRNAPECGNVPASPEGRTAIRVISRSGPCR